MATATSPVGIILAPSRSSHMHLCLATLPLFILLLYFLYLALKRPSLAEDDEEEEEAQIPLLHMLYVYLTLFVLWSTLAAYLAWFVPRRRDLIARYRDLGFVVTGNVEYVRPGRWRKALTCRRSFAPEYARLTYVHPQDDDDVAVVADADSAAPPSSASSPSPLEGGTTTTTTTTTTESAATVAGHGKNKNKCGRRIVTKTVRTYHPYARESVPVLVLSNLPRSGQPKIDIDVDFASFDGRDRNGGILCIIWAWMIFLVIGSIFVVCMMTMLDDPSEPADFGFFVLAMAIFVVSPIVAAGGNMLRWWMYSQWMMSGKVITEDEYEEKKRRMRESVMAEDRATRKKEEEEDVPVDGGMCMSTLCGDSSDIELLNNARYHTMTDEGILT